MTEKTKAQSQAGEMQARFERIRACSDAQIRILESLRSTDQDQAIKAAGILAFSGLMIACLLVQLSAGSDSLISIEAADPTYIITRLSLVCLFLTAILALTAITYGRIRYDGEPEKALNQYADVLARKRALVITAGGICVVGTIGSLLALFVSLFA